MKDKYLNELIEGFSPLNVIEEASRCLLCLDAPCSKFCPAGTSPDKFIRSVRFRNFKGAAETVRENNALGAICARICPTERYCQQGCSRSGIDRPIDIGQIQRFVTDYEEKLNMKILQSGSINNKSIGIIGSGPSSLQAAVSLRKLGYEVSIYEKEKVFGGMLRIIPEYRLPNRIVDTEIKRIKDLGVHFINNTNVGVNISLDELKSKHDAVLIAIGYSYGKNLPMFENNRNVVLAVDFLKKVKAHKGNVKLPDNVLVIGGGDIAMDTVTTLKLLGVKYVTDVTYEHFDEFKVSKKEFSSAQQLGVTIIDGYAIDKVKGKTVTFVHREIPGQIKIKADKIILANGQCLGANSLSLNLVNNKVYSGKKYLTSDPKVFVCRDFSHTNYNITVVGAIRSAKEVALLIDETLRRAK